VAELTGTNSVAFGRFGYSVALSASGTVALVGAPNQNVGANSAQGAAYLFSGPNWTNQVELTSSDGASSDHFGSSVSLSSSGTTALIGAIGHVVGGNTSQGEAYVFTGSGTNWTQQAVLIASDGAMSDGFGSSVALAPSGTTALIGANGHAGRKQLESETGDRPYGTGVRS
jgi:hypothetical protein